MLSKESVEEFKGIYRQEYGHELSEQEAIKLATEFITFFRAIYRPIPTKIKQDKYGKDK